MYFEKKEIEPRGKQWNAGSNDREIGIYVGKCKEGLVTEISRVSNSEAR